MKDTIKQVLQILKDEFGVSVFTNQRQFKAALVDVRIDSDAKKIRNLLNIAIGDIQAYSRLKSGFGNNDSFIIDNLAAEMSSDYFMDVNVARMTIECVAELLGYEAKSTQNSQGAPHSEQEKNAGDKNIAVQSSAYTEKTAGIQEQQEDQGNENWRMGRYPSLYSPTAFDIDSDSWAKKTNAAEMKIESHKLSAKKGDADAQNLLGYSYQSTQRQQSIFYPQCLYSFPNDPDQAVYWYRKAADQGHDYGQNNLGWCYQNGIGVEQDPVQAVHWYKKAAKQEHEYAQNNLGWCYQYGTGIERNPVLAVNWYRKAADQGYTYAQNNLGWCYQNGFGVEKDLAQARYWYGRAAAQGLQVAQTNLDSL